MLPVDHGFDDLARPVRLILWPRGDEGRQAGAGLIDAVDQGIIAHVHIEPADPLVDLRGQVQIGPAGGFSETIGPGGLAVGIIYGTDQLVALNSGRLHTKMFVQPDGLKADGVLPQPLYTTATSRVNRGLEILISYAQKNVDGGRLWLFAWPIPDNPWQWFRELSSLTCNITHGVDQGGHAQKLLYYANHTDKLDEGDPPQWKSAMYLWNYCDEAWDLTWEHVYRAD